MTQFNVTPSTEPRTAHAHLCDTNTRIPQQVLYGTGFVAFVACFEVFNINNAGSRGFGTLHAV